MSYLSLQFLTFMRSNNYFRSMIMDLATTGTYQRVCKPLKTINAVNKKKTLVKANLFSSLLSRLLMAVCRKHNYNQAKESHH